MSETEANPVAAATATVSRTDLIRRLLGLFSPPGRVVDLATGHGKFARVAAQEGWQVTAVDARTERFPDPRPADIEWVQSDIRDLDVEPFDVVMCLGLFYHLTLEDQLDLLSRVRCPMIIDTHIDHGVSPHEAKLSDRVELQGYRGRFYKEPGLLTSSWGNDESFWPDLESFHRMLTEAGFPLVLTKEPWLWPDRTMFVALPEGA